VLVPCASPIAYFPTSNNYNKEEYCNNKIVNVYNTDHPNTFPVVSALGPKGLVIYGPHVSVVSWQICVFPFDPIF